MALWYLTSLTTGSALADAGDSAAHDRWTRQRQGTGAGHPLLALT